MRIHVAIVGLLAGYLMFCGCTQKRPPQQESNSTQTDVRSVGPTLIKLYPDETIAGHAFNRQANGSSALAAATQNAKNNTAIIFDGQRLETVFGGESLLTAVVPPALYARPGKHEVFLQTDSHKSNVLFFEVR